MNDLEKDGIEFRGTPIRVGEEVLVEYQHREVWCRVTSFGESLSYGLLGITLPDGTEGSVHFSMVRDVRRPDVAG